MSTDVFRPVSCLAQLNYGVANVEIDGGRKSARSDLESGHQSDVAATSGGV
jgi:hypothetical protein